MHFTAAILSHFQLVFPMILIKALFHLVQRKPLLVSLETPCFYLHVKMAAVRKGLY